MVDNVHCSAEIVVRGSVVTNPLAYTRRDELFRRMWWRAWVQLVGSAMMERCRRGIKARSWIVSGAV